MQSTRSGFRPRQLILQGLIALSLAFLIWLYTHSRAQMTLEHVQIPVQIQLATSQRDLFGMEIVGEPKIIATFTGPASRLRELRKRLQRGQVQVNIIHTVADDKAGDATCTDVVRVEPSHIPVGPGIHVDIIEDSSSVRLSLHRMAEKILPVRLEYTGDARVSQVKVEPSTVQVRGPQAVLEKATSISTQPYAFTLPEESADPTVRDKVALVTDIDGRPIFTNPKQVVFRCKVQPKHKVYEVHDVPVLFLCPPQLPYRPRFANDKAGKISVRIVGPAAEEKPPVLAFVELTGPSLTRGRNMEPVRLQLPKDFTLLSNSTPVIAFFLDEVERPALVGPEAPKD